MSDSTRKFFGPFSIEWTYSPGFYMGLQYSRRENDHSIYLGFLWRIWITIYTKKYSPEYVSYGIRIEPQGVNFNYGKSDEIEGGGKSYLFWWSTVIDFILGKPEVYTKSQSNLSEHVPHKMRMIHGDEYNVKIHKTDYIQIRRGIVYHRWVRFNCIPDRGVPHAGKGENSWDCGDDATYEFSTCCDFYSEALEQFRTSCERVRKKYGMASDIPMEPMNLKIN